MLDHTALLYSSHEELIAGFCDFVDEGVHLGEPVVTIADEPHAQVLWGALERNRSDARSGWVSFIGDVVRFRRPAAAVAEYRRLIDERLARGARRVRLLAQLDFDATQDQGAEFARYEAVLNRAFADTAVSICCPYDMRSVQGAALRQVEQTHPNLLTTLGNEPSSHYLDPADLARGFDPGHLELEESEPVLKIELDRALGTARRDLRTAVATAKLPPDRVDDLVIAFNEVATNAIVHGRGAIGVKVWADTGVAVCTVSDQGTKFDDALCGYVPPLASKMAGRGLGLWISRQLCDEVDIVPSATGLKVRLVMRM